MAAGSTADSQRRDGYDRAMTASPAPAALLARVPERLLALTDRRRIAVLPLKGVIGGALRAPDVVRTLDRLGENGHVRAVVLDIGSPGGAATGAEALYLAVRRLAGKK